MSIAKFCLATGFVLGLCVIPGVAFGQFADGFAELATASGGAYAPGRSLPSVIGVYIQAFIGILGVVFLLLTVYAGFLWMTAQGDDGKVKQAKETLVRAVIGMIIILSAYSITTFIVARIDASAQGVGPSEIVPED